MTAWCWRTGPECPQRAVRPWVALPERPSTADAHELLIAFGRQLVSMMVFHTPDTDVFSFTLKVCAA